MQALITGQTSPISLLFANNAIGRVDPAGKFLDHDGVVEYVYGTVCTEAARISNINFKKLVSQDNLVLMNVVLTFDVYDNTQQNIFLIIV